MYLDEIEERPFCRLSLIWLRHNLARPEIVRSFALKCIRDCKSAHPQDVIELGLFDHGDSHERRYLSVFKRRQSCNVNDASDL